VDVMAGFVIVRDKKEYECFLRPERIVETVFVNGEKVPLQSLEDWKRYFELMGRREKVLMMNN